MEVRGAWMQSEFWARHWSKAADNPCRSAPTVRCAAAWPACRTLRLPTMRCVRRCSASAGWTIRTRPARSHRGTGHAPIPPDWSHGNAIELLGSDAKRWVAHFDRQWCRDHASEWKLHHAWLMQCARVQVLTADMAQNQAQDLVELARLMRLLDPRAVVRPLYEQALAHDPQHAGCCAAWCRICPMPIARPSSMACSACGTVRG